MISRENRKILDFDDDHPAKRFLVEHEKFCRECVGFEVVYSGRPAIADVTWISDVLQGRSALLSHVLYKYLSFTPVLIGWIDSSADTSEADGHDMANINVCRRLLLEAKIEAGKSGNMCAEAIIDRAEAIVDLWEASIKARYL